MDTFFAHSLDTLLKLRDSHFFLIFLTNSLGSQSVPAAKQKFKGMAGWFLVALQMDGECPLQQVCITYTQKVLLFLVSFHGFLLFYGFLGDG